MPNSLVNKEARKLWQLLRDSVGVDDWECWRRSLKIIVRKGDMLFAFIEYQPESGVYFFEMAGEGFKMSRTYIVRLLQIAKDNGANFVAVQCENAKTEKTIASLHWQNVAYNIWSVKL